MMRMSIVIVGRNFAKDAANAKHKVNISWNCQISQIDGYIDTKGGLMQACK